MNRNRLRRGEEKKNPRTKNIPRSERIKQTDLDITIKHLEEAAKFLNKYLKGKNHLGLITNIKNSSYEIKKHLKS